jgi:deoxycytidylate deaminase
MKVYIAGPLSTDKGQQKKKFYEEVARVCQECQIEPYVPHLKTDPLKEPTITPSEVYHWNYEQIKTSDFLIAYVGEPALGVGMEIEIAKQEKVKVILLYESNVYVSRMIRGNPIVSQTITFQTEAEVLEKLKQYLQIVRDPHDPTLYYYVSASHWVMQEAYKSACQSGCGSQQTGAVIVKDDKIIARGHNSIKRNPAPCPRVEQNLPSGIGYELCPICVPANHAEADAIRNAQDNQVDTTGAEMYLWGHWWACSPCWEKVLKAEIKKIYLVEGAEELFKGRGILTNKKWYKIKK